MTFPRILIIYNTLCLMHVQILQITHLSWNEDDVNFGNKNLNEDMIVAVVIAIKAIANLPEKYFDGFESR